MTPLRLGIVTKLWGRPRVAEFVLAYYGEAWAAAVGALLGRPVALACVAAVSPNDEHPPALPPWWEAAEAPNRPLSPKGNHAVRALRGRVDAVMNVGSDDLVSPAYVAAALAEIGAGHDYIDPRGLVLYDLATDRAMTVDAPRVGAGRLWSAALLDALDWAPWPDRGHAPDADSETRAHNLGLRPATARVAGAALGEGLVVCDVKCGDNISSYDEVEGRRAPEGRVRAAPVAALEGALGLAAGALGVLSLAHAAHLHATNRTRYAMNPDRQTASPDRPVPMVALRPFHSKAEEGAVQRGARFFASERRAADLAASRLARRSERTGDGPAEAPGPSATKPDGPAATKAKATPKKAATKTTATKKAAPKKATKKAPAEKAVAAETGAA